MTLTHTQQTILHWLDRHGPTTSAAVAAEFGVGQATAQTHLYQLRLAGVVKRQGMGVRARWQAEIIDESPLSRTEKPNPIWQCPIVWVYASRVGATAIRAG